MHLKLTINRARIHAEIEVLKAVPLYVNTIYVHKIEVDANLINSNEIIKASFSAAGSQDIFATIPLVYEKPLKDGFAKYSATIPSEIFKQSKSWNMVLGVFLLVNNEISTLLTSAQYNFEVQANGSNFENAMNQEEKSNYMNEVGVLQNALNKFGETVTRIIKFNTIDLGIGESIESSNEMLASYGIGSLYLNTDNGCYYKCLDSNGSTTSTWQYLGNFTGPQGQQGPQGLLGAEGPQGPIGPAGINSALLENEAGNSNQNGYTQNRINNLISNPNLLTNGDFKIHQKGIPYITQSHEYICNRFYGVFDGNVKMEQISPISGGIRVTNNGGNNYINIETKLEFIGKGTNVLTVYFDDVDKINLLYIYPTTITKTYFEKNYENNSWSIKLDVPEDYSYGIRLGVQCKTSADISECYKIKLEEGDFSTNYTSKLKSQELLDCQRYSVFYNKNYTTIATGVMLGEKLGFANIALPNNLRVDPSITFNELYGNGYGQCGENSIKVLNLRDYRVNGNQLSTLVDFEEPIQGNCFTLQIRNNGYIEIDAEI